MKITPWKMVTGVATVVAIITGIFTIDNRYVKSDTVEILKVQIVDEMRREVVKNRSVMIQSMQREADDLEYNIHQLEIAGEQVPRYMIEKLKLITRQIETLKDDINEKDDE